jgi:hypothetical protein
MKKERVLPYLVVPRKQRDETSSVGISLRRSLGDEDWIPWRGWRSGNDRVRMIGDVGTA